MYILDTNVVSELRRPDKADKRVTRWAGAVPLSGMYLSAMTIMELELGVLLKNRKDKQQGHILREWLDNQVLRRFDGRVLAYDTDVALRCAQLHVPDPVSERDAIIAATALVHGMTIVTRNVSDFDKTGAEILNPWD